MIIILTNDTFGSWFVSLKDKRAANRIQALIDPAEDGMMKKITTWLNENCAARKEPQIFLAEISDDLAFGSTTTMPQRNR